MALRVLAWNPVPGRDLPEPVIEDDSKVFLPHVVTEVRAWLKKRTEELRSKLQAEGPTPQILSLERANGPVLSRFQFDPKALDAGGLNMGAVKTPGGFRSVTFEYGTFQVNMKSKKLNAILAVFNYAGARDPITGRVIVGELLSVEQKGRIA